jgi:hypothetical protein
MLKKKFAAVCGDRKFIAGSQHSATDLKLEPDISSTRRAITFP